MGPSRSTEATLKVFSNQRRLRLRDLAPPRRACAPARPSTPSASARGAAPRLRPDAQEAPATGASANCPAARARAQWRPCGRVTSAGLCGNGRKAFEDLSWAGRRGSRENVPKPWLLSPEGARAGRASAETQAGLCGRELQARVLLPDPATLSLVDDLLVFMGTSAQVN